MEEENNVVTANIDSSFTEYEIEDIKKKIYTIRGKQVMLDSEVAELYNGETRIINQVVKRNIKGFLKDIVLE